MLIEYEFSVYSVEMGSEVKNLFFPYGNGLAVKEKGACELGNEE